MQAQAVEQLRTMQRAGLPVPPEAIKQARQAEGGALLSAASIAVVIPLTAAVLAGLLIGWFNTIGGGEARYRQVLAIVAHSSLIWCLSGVIAAGAGYFKGEIVNAPGALSALAPMLDETGFPGRFLGFIDLFWIWGLINLAIGVAVLYRRRTGGIATSLVSIYVAIALVYAIVRSSLGV
jgi:hypothetical protein